MHCACLMIKQQLFFTECWRSLYQRDEWGFRCQSEKSGRDGSKEDTQSKKRANRVQNQSLLHNHIKSKSLTLQIAHLPRRQLSAPTLINKCKALRGTFQWSTSFTYQQAWDPELFKFDMRPESNHSLRVEWNSNVRAAPLAAASAAAGRH